MKVRRGCLEAGRLVDGADQTQILHFQATRMTALWILAPHHLLTFFSNKRISLPHRERPPRLAIAAHTHHTLASLVWTHASHSALLHALQCAMMLFLQLFNGHMWKLPFFCVVK